MSHPASHWALYYADCPSASARYVLMILAEAHNGTDDQCNPSIKRLVTLSGLKRRAVFLALKSLEDAGLITRRKLYHKNGRQAGVFYELNMTFDKPRLPKPERGEGAKYAPYVGALNAPSPVQNMHPSKENRERRNLNKEMSAPSEPTVFDEEKENEFDMVWREFPNIRTSSKLKAKRAYFKKIREKDKVNFFLAVAAYAEDVAERKKKRSDVAVMHMSTFINEERWLNFVPQKEAAE